VKTRLRNATPKTETQAEVKHPEVNDFECFSGEAGGNFLSPEGGYVDGFIALRPG
jgi:hypothetical protein